jgi:hypothetical protein
MSTIVTRSGKGSPLTYDEVDSNFTNLNTDKYQAGGALGTPASGTLTNCTGLPNDGLVNSSITINGTAISLGGSVTTPSGTVTSVTGTSPVVSSGGTTPAISMPAATTSANGYLTSTDWNTFNGKLSATSPAITGTIIEDVYTITDGAGFAIDPTNGSIQLVTLGANRTPTVSNFDAGEGITLMINDGTAYTITWTTIGVVWVGGTAPTLALTGYTVIELWKVGSTIYGALVGSVA